MAIDSFLKEYRDYMYTKNTLLNQINNNSSASDIYVITHHCISILKELKNQMSYLDKNLIDIEEEINLVFENVYKKIKKIEDIAEGYQNLNTNELIAESIKSFKSFNIKNRILYDKHYNGITLPRTNKINNLTTNFIIRNNIDGKEIYKNISIDNDFFIKVKPVDINKTIIKKVSFYSKEDLLLEEFFNKFLIKAPKDTNKIIVHSDNVLAEASNYTELDILNDKFSKEASVTLEEESFKKEGNLFKLNIDYILPTQCYATLKLVFKFKNLETNKNEQIIVYTSLNNTRDILIRKNEAKKGSKLKDIYNNILPLENIKNDQIVFSPEYSTDEEVIKHIGNKVFNISKIKSKDFNLALSISLYSLIDETKTPIIKGLFGYVTD